MRVLGFVSLLIVLFASLFKVWGAELTNNILGLCLMILLTILFSDLNEFNFWGLIGKKGKEEENLKRLKDEEPLAVNPPDKPLDNDLPQPETPAIQLMDNPTGNFLALAFEIERLLRVSASYLVETPIAPDANNLKIVKLLKEKGLLTESGEQQVASIRWLRNMIVHGRINEVNIETLNSGIEIAYKLYMELKTWLENTNQQNQNPTNN